MTECAENGGSFGLPFSESGFYTKTIKDLAAWRLARTGGQRLLLPPIQRSVLWSNEQIINYWDSLLRGYPCELMIVHSVTKCESEAGGKGRDADGTTCFANEGDLLLIDGQQRVASILLGFGEGQMKNNHKLWIDLGSEPATNSGLKFQLRMTSTGQPFGYNPDAPNQKLELRKRKNKWEAWNNRWRNSKAEFSVPKPQEAFEKVDGSDLIDAQCAGPVSKIYECLCNDGCDNTVAKFCNYKGASGEIVVAFVRALESTLNSKVALQEIHSKIAANSVRSFFQTNWTRRHASFR